ncbi:MAG TPA: hypothetical protein VJN22_00800 [Candidatus Eremiobacteraceae bacterium]|nr:hypothetical protein [Candidatus Eremiobacteraceae bacterium]
MTPIAALLLATLSIQGPTLAPGGCAAGRILSEARAVTGGDRWNDVGEIITEGGIDDAGAKGSFRAMRDLKTGRNAFKESLGVGRVAYIYDGHVRWEVDQAGGVHALSAPDSVARAITGAYLDRGVLWSDSPNDVKLRCVKTASEGDRAFDVIRVRPSEGSFADLWVDRKTHLIDRKIEQYPTTTMTERYADYRRTDGLTLPYMMTRRYDDQSGAPTETQEVVRAYRVLRAASATDFTRPPDPPPGHLVGHAHSIVVPISIDHGVTIFSATIGRQGPFAFTFDPGAQGVLTTVASSRIGLAPGAMHRVRTIRIGDAEIDDIDLPIYGGAATDLFPQRTIGLPPIAGSLGPELLDRFDVRLNYSAKTATLAPLGDLRCSEAGTVERFVLQEDDDIPLVHASIDGHDGLFQFDLRAPASLILFRPFDRRTGVAISPSGAIHSLVIGGTRFRDVRVRFTTATTGKFASRTEAGLLGSGILSRFITTIDYRDQTICFEPPKN